MPSSVLLYPHSQNSMGVGKERKAGTKALAMLLLRGGESLMVAKDKKAELKWLATRQDLERFLHIGSCGQQVAYQI